MVQGYLDGGMKDEAVFEFFIRKLPENRNFFLSAGLEQVLQFLETLRFSPEEVEFLSSTGKFNRKFLDYIGQIRFTGQVDAIPEGRIFFANEPLLRIIAPIPEAQLVETRIINLLHYQTLVASKAARIVLSAPGKLLVDFGLRRAHGSEAGLYGARACYIAGFDGSSNVLAEKVFGITSYGTMAHSFIQAHDSESEAFEAYAKAQPENVTLLIDTYDTVQGAQKVAALVPRLRQAGIRIKAVRLDSGDLDLLSRKVRKVLDEGGAKDTGIFASGNLDENIVARLAASGAPIDGYGVGTRLLTSNDAPYLDCAYKLQEYAGKPRRKRSEGKATWPGRKAVFRFYDKNGTLEKDLLTLVHESSGGEPLLETFMKNGKRVKPAVSLKTTRDLAAAELKRLPPGMRSLISGDLYKVEISPSILNLAREIDLLTAGEKP